MSGPAMRVFSSPQALTGFSLRPHPHAPLALVLAALAVSAAAVVFALRQATACG
jgi:hypothetical protein